jgi:peptide-methionine (S)-S-oxide reductase
MSAATMRSAATALLLLLLLLLLAPPPGGLVAADYTVLPGQKTAMFAGGCFWCMEEAFEKYAPGVADAVSGYAGGSNDNPTYQDHGRYDETGHYEVVLVIYDPELATFDSLLEYFWRNIDPTDGAGQFCDRGHAYAPAVFYEDADEQAAIQCSLAAVQSAHPSWGPVSESVEVRAKPRFWEAEDYHQNYYQISTFAYNYYKDACRRSQVLRQRWGDGEFECFHTRADEVAAAACEASAAAIAGDFESGGADCNGNATAAGDAGRPRVRASSAEVSGGKQQGVLLRMLLLLASAAVASGLCFLPSQR